MVSRHLATVWTVLPEKINVFFNMTIFWICPYKEKSHMYHLCFITVIMKLQMYSFSHARLATPEVADRPG